MDGARVHRNGYRLLPRMSWPRDAVDAATRVPRDDIPSVVVARAASSTSCDSSNSNLCEKPVGSMSTTLPIALGIAVPVVVTIVVLLYLHRRNIRKQKQEDLADPHKSLDFGMMMDPGKKGKGGRKNNVFGAEKEGNPARHRQLSMDMNLSSPYLLPPGLQSSRESLHSLARTLHQNEDPYRPVAQYATSDVHSLRSFRKETRDGSSIYTGSSGGRESGVNTRGMGSATTLVPPPRQNSLPKTPPTPIEPRPAHIGHTPSDVSLPGTSSPPRLPFVPMEPTIPVIETVPYPEDQPSTVALDMPVPSVQEPPPVAQKSALRGMPSSPKPRAASPPVAQPAPEQYVVQDGFRFDDGPNEFSVQSVQPRHVGPETAVADVTSPHSQQASLHMSPPRFSVPENPYHQEPTLPSTSAPILEEPLNYTDSYYGPEGTQGQQDHYHDPYASAHRRQSSLYDQDPSQDALGVPQRDTKRLSVGFRPLPPDEMMDTEDPETRANRIRSFYKEYFEETKPDPNAPMPQYGNNTYYEDYDEQYLGDTTYFDPENNAFVMPYAQPVARRAMTPPPSGSRLPGPRPPRGYHSSVGGMSHSGGRVSARPGSSASSRMGPRPGSSVSNRMPGSRVGSSMSGRYGAPRKALPPPAALSTLPTPSKLKDDSFALMGAIEFAPPTTFRDQAAGRSQSPHGERRPYQPKLPVVSPLMSSYDDMAVLPSPHSLRKSGTFTGLDFAPPRKFKENETMNDAGSIRSNRSGRSGISAVQQQALRSGAGRVSRLPGDTVFTQAALGDTLKPSWNMRN